jgi:hypothetical protein
MGLDTKTYWLTDCQSQCDFHIDSYLVMSPRWGSTPRLTDWLAVSRNVTSTWTWGHREGAPQKQNLNCQEIINIWSWAPDGARHQDWLTDWLTDRQSQCDFDLDLRTRQKRDEIWRHNKRDQWDDDELVRSHRLEGANSEWCNRNCNRVVVQ